MLNPIIHVQTYSNQCNNNIINSTNLVRSMLCPQENINYMEIWNYVNNAFHNIKDVYHVSNFGRFYSARTNRILLHSKGDGGYLRVSVRDLQSNGKALLVHRAVLAAFNYRPDYENLEVNHIDGIKTNNFLWNLEWSTRKENAEHAVNEGLYLRGQDKPGSIYSESQIRRICYGLSQRWPYDYISEYAGIDYCESIRATIVQIKRGLIWKHISDEYEFPSELSYQIFTNNQIHDICRLIDSGITDYTEILKQCGIEYNNLNVENKRKYSKCITDIINCKRFTSISKNYDFYIEPQSTRTFTNSQINTICSLIDAGVEHVTVILKCIGVDYFSLTYEDQQKYVRYIGKLRAGKMYKHIAKDYEFYKKLQD